MSKKQDTSGTVKRTSAQKWADHVTVSANSNQGGIELRFNAEPSPELQPKLRAMGFRHSKSQIMWYGEETEQAMDFARQVEASLPTSQDGPELFLSPSFDAVKTNIEKKEFSYVLITLKDGQIKSYIVFEPSKPKAEVIAGNFAKKEFGDSFLALAAKPRLHVKEARVLFDEGKIIFPEGQELPVHKASSIKGIQEKATPAAKENVPETSADNQRDVERQALDKFYKWAVQQPDKAAKPSQVSREFFDQWFKENYPAFSEKNIESIWQSHSRIVKSLTRIEKRSANKDVLQPFSSIYKKLMQVIPDLITQIEQGKYHGKSQKDPDGGYMDLNYNYVGKDKKGNYLIALSHYFKQNGDIIADPDMQIRIYPDMPIAEAMTYQDQFGYQQVYPVKDGKEYVNPRLKRELNKFLNQWLTNIIRQGHKIDLSKEKSELEKDETTGSFNKAYEQLLQFIPGLLNHNFKGKSVEGEFKTDEKGTRRKIFYTISQRQDEKSYAIWLNEFVGNREELQSDIVVEPQNQTAYVTAEWLSFYYAGKYDREESEEEIDERDGDIGEEMTRGLTEWLEDILNLGYKINLPENTSSVHSDFKRLHTPEEEQEIIEQFLAQGYKRPFRALDAYHQHLPVVDVAFRYDEPLEYFRENIEEPKAKKIEKLRKELKELKGKGTNEQREKLKAEIESLTIAINTAEQLINEEADIFHDDLFQLILDKAKEKGLHPEGEDEIAGFRDYVMTNILDNRAIENYHRQPINEVIDELIDEYFSKDKNAAGYERPSAGNEKATATDLKSGDTFVPNVLVPSETKEPFYSHLFSLFDMKEVIKNNFPHLLQINDGNLGNASPIALFELIQFSHPSEYGIRVNRQQLLKEFEKRGKSIFKAIGFPTDANYPYVNLHLGYESIEPLNEMLFDNNKEGDEWWAIAENSRPVADIKKGIKLIGQMIEKEKQEIKTYLNPKTGKPKLEYKQQVRDIEFTIRGYEESKEVLQHYLDNPSKAPEETETINTDPLANEHGVYTIKTAGNNFEEIDIPMPKGAQYEANVVIVKTSAGDYKVGLNASKKFGDSSGIGFAPSIEGVSYATREEALKFALKHHEIRLEVMLEAKDSILNNEQKKNRQLTMALAALKKFAEENNIVLDEKSSHEETATQTKNNAIIKGLEAAYWTKEDNEYPQNKAIVNSMEFQQARLREAISARLQKLPLHTLQNIVDELSQKFTERKPLNTYDKGYVTIGKTGDKRTAALIAIYVDNMIVDNDLTDKKNFPVMGFLINILFSDEQTLVDLPQNIEKQSETKMKKQSQYDLNKEIENFIDEKDKNGSYFNEEEKNYIRQYTGSGGLLKEGAVGRGVLYEYYTPEIVVKKMWDMAYHYGYDGGSILEPSVGTGNFLKYVPKGTTAFGYETNHYSARIAQILYPNANIQEKAFETLFFTGNIHLKDKFENPGYSLVIGNPPYGEFTGKYAGMGEKQHTGATEYDQYFILRGLDLLKNNGLLVYLIPSSFMSNNAKFNKVKEKIAAKADLVDCYRLPNRIFQTTDIGTDILVLRKNQ